MKRLPPTNNGERIRTLREVNEYLTELLRQQLPVRPLPDDVAARLLAEVLREVHELLGSGEAH